MPALSISRWLGTSASAGFSLNVGMQLFDQRMFPSFCFERQRAFMYR
jgi:hypothetical protein